MTPCSGERPASLYFDVIMSYETAAVESSCLNVVLQNYLSIFGERGKLTEANLPQVTITTELGALGAQPPYRTNDTMQWGTTSLPILDVVTSYETVAVKSSCLNDVLKKYQSVFGEPGKLPEADLRQITITTELRALVAQRPYRTNDTMQWRTTSLPILDGVTSYETAVVESCCLNDVLKKN